MNSKTCGLNMGKEKGCGRCLPASRFSDGRGVCKECRNKASKEDYYKSSRGDYIKFLNKTANIPKTKKNIGANVDNYNYVNINNNNEKSQLTKVIRTSYLKTNNILNKILELKMEFRYISNMLFTLIAIVVGFICYDHLVKIISNCNIKT